MKISPALLLILFTLSAHAADEAPVAPATAAAPFALTSVTLAQINASSPYFLVDGKVAELLAKPPAKLEDLQVLRLWPENAPLQHGDDPAVDVPTLTVFLPPTGQASGAAMVVIPGGGYDHVSPREGIPAGQWLAKNGITAFVLHYRVGRNNYRYPAEIDDGVRAVRYVRANAPAWGLDPHRVGIIGFSAGGHLASTLATHFDAGQPDSPDPIERASSRPDLHILLYPVMTLMDESIVERGSRSNLLGVNPSDELKELLSNDRHVTKETPPAFIVHSTQDTTVPIANSDHYTDALAKNNIPFVYIRQPMGGHGFGITDAWKDQAMAWLHLQKF
ncbi:MAG TPA: alpha/beta hydrolase [Verrucomicrobiae bacterium]|nr:alpha/beta hydrolase [Verrucomicrobiae bacterium]